MTAIGIPISNISAIIFMLYPPYITTDIR